MGKAFGKAGILYVWPPCPRRAKAGLLGIRDVPSALLPLPYKKKEKREVLDGMT